MVNAVKCQFSFASDLLLSIRTMLSFPLTLLVLFLCKDIRLHLKCFTLCFHLLYKPYSWCESKVCHFHWGKKNINIKWLLCVSKPEKHFSDQNCRFSAAMLFRITSQSSNMNQPEGIGKYHCRGFFLIEKIYNFYSFFPVCMINYCGTESDHLNIK